MNEGNHPGFEGGLRLPFKGVWSKIGDDVFIAPTATVIAMPKLRRSGYHVWLYGSRGYELDQNWRTIESARPCCYSR